MSHRTAVTALILVVALSATLAYAGPANLLRERPASLIAAAADVPAEPSSVIAAGDFNHDGIADLVEVILPGGKTAGRRFLDRAARQARRHVCPGSFKKCGRR